MIVLKGYIIAVSATDENRDLIIDKIKNKPTDPDGYQHKLRADSLEWELVELPDIEPAEDEAGPEDYEQALQQLGVDFSD